jgi:hypothetical protein
MFSNLFAATSWCSRVGFAELLSLKAFLSSLGLRKVFIGRKFGNGVSEYFIFKLALFL